MIRRTEYFKTIDKYLNNELTEPEINELELEMRFNSDLVEEFNLHLNVQQAVQEHEIINLREKINKIINNQTITDINDESDISGSFNFELAEEMTSANNFNSRITIEDINTISHSFPKIHLYQHLIAAKENIYQFYKGQNQSDSINEKESFSPMDNALFEDIENALKETDLLDLRANLKQIAATMPEHSRSAEEINNYVYHLMTREQRIEFEEELGNNTNLAIDVRLFNEIDLAASENDIMNLRASLQKIQKEEIQKLYSTEEIEGYINNELSEQEMALFETELTNNKALNSEIDLIRNLDKALQENDIMQLRNNLSNISADNIKERQSERSIVVKFRPRKNTLSIAAASLILLLGITGLLSRYSSEDNIYQKFYNRYETSGISRSSNAMNDQALALALQKFNNKDYISALNLFQEVISKDQNNVVGHFYSGVSLQELGKYKNAIDEYEVVVNETDNLFIEQAEWYIGLCYIQTKEDNKAIKQFNKIADNNQGFYQQRAVAILRKIKNKL